MVGSRNECIGEGLLKGSHEVGNNTKENETGLQINNILMEGSINLIVQCGCKLVAKGH